MGDSWRAQASARQGPVALATALRAPRPERETLVVPVTSETAAPRIPEMERDGRSGQGPLEDVDHVRGEFPGRVQVRPEISNPHTDQALRLCGGPRRRRELVTVETP
jgi:hypothetical protein